MSEMAETMYVKGEYTIGNTRINSALTELSAKFDCLFGRPELQIRQVLRKIQRYFFLISQ